MPTGEQPFYKSKWFLTILVTTGCFLFTYLYFHFFYVEYEALNDAFYSGKLTEGMPFRSLYFLGNIGTSYIYSWCYEMWPQVEWISWILYSYLFISCFIGLYLILTMLPETYPLWARIAVQVLVYILVFADHNIHFIYTRVSYMVTGVSLLGLVYYFSAPGLIRTRPVLFILLNIWFVIGTLTRSESATAVLLQVCFFGVFYLQDIRRFVSVFLFPVLFTVSLLVGIAYDLRTATDFYLQVEPDVEAQFCERKNIVPLSEMKTLADSVKWKAAKNILWVDPKISTPSYFRSLIRPEKLIYTDVRQWQRVYRDVSEIAGRFWYLTTICILLGLALLVTMPFRSRLSYLFWFVFVASFWLLIAIQTYTVKVNDRSFSPLIGVFIFCHLFVILPYIRSGMSRWLYPILACVVVLSGVQFYHLKKEANQLQHDLDGYRQNTKVIAEIATGKVLVVNSSSCDYLFLSNRPFQPFDFSVFKKLYIVDGFNMPFLPYYRRYLEKECGCDMAAFPSFWDYLRSRHDEVVLISVPHRIDILRDYMRVIHAYELPVTEDTTIQLLKLQKSDSRGSFANLKVYSLGR